MTTFASLISGSSGNAAYISDGKTHILTDCGTSGAKLKTAMEKIGASPENVHALLITHEHGDHIRGAGVIARRYGIPVYTTYETFCAMDCGRIDDSLVNFIRPDEDFEIGTIGIMPFSIPHDAANPVGFNYFVGGEKLSLATDIGHMNEYVMSHISGSQKIILESNHDVELLQIGSYPYAVKRRVLSDVGHLSNKTAAETALELVKSGTQSIVLGHLSNENNRPEIAMLETYTALTDAGVNVGSDMVLSVARRYEPTVI